MVEDHSPKNNQTVHKILSKTDIEKLNQKRQKNEKGFIVKLKDKSDDGSISFQ